MQERRKRVLVVDDDQAIQIATKYVLKDKYDCMSVYNGEEALAVLQRQPFDVVLLDIHMRYHEEGLEYLPKLKAIDPDRDFIIVSANTEIDLASRAIRSGASAYLIKEHSVEQLLITIESVLSKRELIHENQHYVRDRKRTLEKNRIIGESSAIKQLMADIEKIRRSNANVVITAETGAGKELVARHIGASEGKPFVAVDSATITSSMAESILFGHEKGAFTGAHAMQRGLFEEANGGTIYFDEIVNMPLDIQAKILRAIEEKEIMRLGSTRAIPLEFRVICATNKDLEKLVAEGKFKDDLYQRLNVITLRIPPLRERVTDIPALVGHFLSKFKSERSAKMLSEDATALLMKYSWPGNVRELSNVVANLCTMIVDQEAVESEDLPEKIRDAALAKTIPPPKDGMPSFKASFEKANTDFYSFMHALEGSVLRELSEAFEGNITQMSKTLKISRSHLYSKMNTHKLLG